MQMDSVLVFILAMMVPFLICFIQKMVTGHSCETTPKDWLLYFLIAPLMIAAFLGSFFYADSKGIDEEVTVKWMNIFITAVFVFGYPAKKFWQYHRRWTFWVELSLLVVAHFIALQKLRWQKASYFLLLGVVSLPQLAPASFLMP